MVSLPHELFDRFFKKLPAGFYESALNNSRNLIFAKDKNFKIIYANEAFLNLYPVDKRDKIIGFTAAERFSEEEKTVFFAEDRKALNNGYSEIIEEITDYKGNLRIFQMQKIRCYDEHEKTPYILAIGNDITTHIMREQDLTKSNVTLEAFAAMAAHDLRSPLASICSSIDAVQNDKQTNLGPQAHKHIQLISQCLEGLIEQVSELLEASKIRKEEKEQEFSEFDMAILFEEVRFNLSSRIKETNAKILSTSMPKIRANKPLIRQLIHNLIENSLKYRSKKNPIIILRYEAQDDCHLFAIEDNGKGIPYDKKSKIFDLYHQGDRKAEGYGIGLSLCKNIVELHGGRIWIDEYFENGCRIYFELPTSLQSHINRENLLAIANLTRESDPDTKM